LFPNGGGSEVRGIMSDGRYRQVGQDVVIITELYRLSRTVKDLFEIVDRIHNIGADIKSLKESWIDTTTPQGKLLFTIFAGISQFERDLIVSIQPLFRRSNI